MKIYVGVRDKTGRATVSVREFDHSWLLPLEPSLEVYNHSPDGFEWGYAGSGPAQLAIALLLDCGASAKEAELWHQEFKDVFLSGLKKARWECPAALFKCWVLGRRHRDKHPSITCPRCGRTSYNTNDIKERYCGYCHMWHENMGVKP